MSVPEAVARAMRSGRVITPNEFPAIQRQALATVDIGQIQTGDYLLRGEAAEALRVARFRNDAERRAFYVEFLQQARDRVLTQVHTAMAAIPASERAQRLACFAMRREGEAGPVESPPAQCIGHNSRGDLYFEPGRPWRHLDGSPGSQSAFRTGLLEFLGSILAAQAFVGVPTHYFDLFDEIQLLDGVEYRVENYEAAQLPAETRISASAIRMIYRANVCSVDSTLPDCR